jgi:hypothetical protein
MAHKTYYRGYDDEGQALARYGWERVADTDGVVTADTPHDVFTAVRAVNGDLTFGPGCEAPAGDAPADGDVLREGDRRPGPLTKIDVKSGVGEVVRG